MIPPDEPPDEFASRLKGLSEELGEPARITVSNKKMKFAIISGILPDSAPYPDPSPPISTFAFDFFDRIINVTFNTTSTSGPNPDKANHLFNGLRAEIKKKLHIEDDAEFEKILQVDDIVEAIKHRDVNNEYPGFTTLALDLFGGHIEFLFLLCMSGLDIDGNPRDSKPLQDLIEKRFGETHSQYTTSYLKDANRIFDYLGVAPVFVKGIQKVGDSEYLTLQLVAKSRGKERLHSTFSILIDDDTANIPPLGTYHLVKLYSGMKELRKSGSSDFLPILLENAKILPSKQFGSWS